MGEVAALAVDTLQKLVTAAGPAQVRPLLPDLVPPLLESLSTLEVRLLAQSIPQGSLYFVSQIVKISFDN